MTSPYTIKEMKGAISTNQIAIQEMAKDIIRLGQTIRGIENRLKQNNELLTKLYNEVMKSDTTKNQEDPSPSQAEE